MSTPASKYLRWIDEPKLRYSVSQLRTQLDAVPDGKLRIDMAYWQPLKDAPVILLGVDRKGIPFLQVRIVKQSAQARDFACYPSVDHFAKCFCRVVRKYPRGKDYLEISADSAIPHSFTGFYQFALALLKKIDEWWSAKGVTRLFTDQLLTFVRVAAAQ